MRFHAAPTMPVRAQVNKCGPKLVANPEHLELLRQGVEVWNAWRAEKSSIRPNLSGANLTKASLDGANLSRANLREANLSEAILIAANLREANLSEAILIGATLFRANLREADLRWTNLREANLSGANLSEANLSEANLSGANLSEANLSEANLGGAALVDTNLIDATLTDCRIYGISAWNVKLNERTKQQGLVITRFDEPAVTVDDLEVAQFVYLLLHNEKIRRVIHGR